MNPDQLYELFQDLQAYVGWADEDMKRVRSIAPIVTPHLDPLIDDFYAEIQRHPQALKVITGGDEQIERLKGTLREWLAELLAAKCDRAYMLRRWRIGWRHVEIGLAQVYTNAAMSRLRTGLTRIVFESSGLETEQLSLTVASLNKLLDLDLAIIEDAYQAEYLARQQRTKRLATIGELAGGIAHELRNPLGIIRNGAYFLRMSQQQLSDDARDALAEMERGMATCNRLVSELLDYVREPKREETAFPLSAAIDEVLAGIDVPATVQVSRSVGLDKAACQADKAHIVQIIANLIGNAVEAMPHGGQLTLSATRRDNCVVFQVTDSGEGIAVTDLDKVFEPLFSRKTKGIGLGLAVSQRYAELNRGHLEVESEPGQGATFRLTLPSADNKEE